MAQDSLWAGLARRYLSLRTADALEASIETASDREISLFLKAIKEPPLQGLASSAEVLSARLHRDHRENEAQTIRLLYLDLLTRLIEVSRFLPERDLSGARDCGISACMDAVAISAEIADDACKAFYLRLLAVGMFERRELAAARLALEETLAIYRELAKQDPSTHWPNVALTLSALGAVLRALRVFDAASTSLKEAVGIARHLARQSPGVHIEHLAQTLNNLGGVLGDLCRFGEAEVAYEEAVACYRAVAERNPFAGSSLVAVSLHNLGDVLEQRGKLDRAKAAVEEALAIFRELARQRPGGYQRELAMTLHTLTNVLSRSWELGAARAAGEEALAIRRELAEQDPDTYGPDVALTLNNLGNVMRELRELGAARAALEEALAIRRVLAGRDPDTYRPDVALTLNNLGIVLRALRELGAAQAALEEALAIRRDLAGQDPDTYRPDVALTLNNFGTLLSDLSELATARTAYEEALATYRDLAGRDPGAYRPNVAMTLNNLGLALMDLREFGAARVAWEEAFTLNQHLGLWIEASAVSANLGIMLRGLQRTDEKAVRHLEVAVELCERGLEQLAERQHRDVFKARLQSAYHVLIDRYAGEATQGDPAAPSDSKRKLLRLLESQRQVSTLSDLGPSSLKDQRAELMDAMEVEAGDPSATVLWIHAVDESVFFVTQKSGTCRVERAPLELLPKMGELFDASERAFLKLLIHRSPLEEGMRIARQAAVAPLVSLGSQAYELLPSGVQRLLSKETVEPVFLSPCGTTINLPWEMLRAPSGWIGLHHALPRVRGMADLHAVTSRQPLGRKVVLTGNPLHEGSKYLEAAKREAQVLAYGLNLMGYEVFPFVDDQATWRALDPELRGEGPTLWIHMGHGGRPENSAEAEYLALAGRDRLVPGEIASRRWTNHPIVHHDCCVAGTVRSRGGGRFDGHPSAALTAGAACVLSSVHPILDDKAAEFSTILYASLLDGANPASIGEALLVARRKTAEQYGGDPLVWATSVLWGNPHARLRR